MRNRTATVTLAAMLWAVPTVAEASFNQQAASAQSASSGMLHPPTNMSLSRSNCTVTLSWTPTVDAKADGYQVLSGGATLVTVSPASATSARFTIAKGVSYSLTMVTTYYNWTSSPNQALAVKC